MKILIAGIVLIVLVGVGGFFYRNMLEQPAPIATACTMEAKICPDGSAVGRSGPSCEFTPCAFPNVSFGTVNLEFALPQGYEKGVQEPGADGYLEGMLDFYQKPGMGGSKHYITIYAYPIPEGKTGEEVILANTVKSPSGLPVESMDEFSPVLINGRTYQSIVNERFEGQVESIYYLVRATDVIRFNLIETDVTEWTNPNLVITNLPEHKAFLEMLGTVQTP